MPFKRFHSDARHTVLLARDNAKRLGSSEIHTEHMLLGLLDAANKSGDNAARRVLERHGLTYGSAYDTVQRMDPNPPLDAQALEAIGIDLEAVRDKLEAVFGKGVLDAPKESRMRGRRQAFAQDSRKTLELSLRESIALKSGYIGAGHLLLALIRADDGAARVLRAAGLDPKALREEVIAELQAEL
jgi:ATP-dependent Clp protease ATP-binding subunit ClpA